MNNGGALLSHQVHVCTILFQSSSPGNQLVGDAVGVPDGRIAQDVMHQLRKGHSHLCSTRSGSGLANWHLGDNFYLIRRLPRAYESLGIAPVLLGDLISLDDECAPPDPTSHQNFACHLGQVSHGSGRMESVSTSTPLEHIGNEFVFPKLFPNLFEGHVQRGVLRWSLRVLSVTNVPRALDRGGSNRG